MSNKTPAEEMMATRRDARDKKRPYQTPKLPITKKTAFVSNLQKIKTNPIVRDAYRDRKVSLFSRREFDLLNRPHLDTAVFGTLKFQRSM